MVGADGGVLIRSVWATKTVSPSGSVAVMLKLCSPTLRPLYSKAMFPLESEDCVENSPSTQGGLSWFKKSVNGDDEFVMVRRSTVLRELNQLEEAKKKVYEDRTER